MNFNRLLQGIPSPLVPRLKDQREFSSMVSLSLSLSLSSSSFFPPPPLLSLFFTPSLFSHFKLPSPILSFPLGLFVFLLIPLCVSHSLSLSLSTRSPCEICIRATRGIIIAKPLSVPWHREQLMTLSIKTCY